MATKRSKRSKTFKPATLAIIIGILVIVFVIVFATQGQTAKFTAVSKTQKLTGPLTSQGLLGCLTNEDCSKGFHCEYAKSTRGTCVQNPPCTDKDGDGYGAEGTDLSECKQTPTAFPMADCDDSDKKVHPSTEEICNGKDDNCNGAIDEKVDSDGGHAPAVKGTCKDSSGVYEDYCANELDLYEYRCDYYCMVERIHNLGKSCADGVLV